MTLQLFLRAITCHMFQPRVTSIHKNVFGKPMCYDDTYFMLTRIVCKDKFNVSIQINNGNYCSSEYGYRKLGYTWETAEFGMSNFNDPDLAKFSGNNSTDGVGSVPVEELQRIFDENHGGIDWEETLSLEACSQLMGYKFLDSFKKVR